MPSAAAANRQPPRPSRIPSPANAANSTRHAAATPTSTPAATGRSSNSSSAPRQHASAIGNGCGPLGYAIASSAAAHAASDHPVPAARRASA